MQAYRMSINEALATLRSSAQGLSNDEALSRRKQYGPNELVEKKKKTLFRMFFDQFTDFMILVLIAAAIVSGVIGEPADAIAIMVIVLLNALLGFSQEYRAERAMAALKKMAAANAVVFRNNEHRAIPASELVAGDVVLLEAGNIVPADIRIIEAAQLKAEEAALTGESIPVEKHTDALLDALLPVGDRRNMLFKGTSITYGRGTGVVTAIGMDTELGRIAALLQQEDADKTPLQKRLANFGTKLAIAILVICVIIFVAGLFRGEAPINIFLVAVSLAVAAIPEALPAVVPSWCHMVPVDEKGPRKLHGLRIAEHDVRKLVRGHAGVAALQVAFALGKLIAHDRVQVLGRAHNAGDHVFDPGVARHDDHLVFPQHPENIVRGQHVQFIRVPQLFPCIGRHQILKRLGHCILRDNIDTIVERYGSAQYTRLY